MEKQVLPRVREGTYQAVKQSLLEYGQDDSFLLSYIDHLYKRNPYILSMMMTWTDDLEGEEYVDALLGYCVMYKMLETELEAQQFEKEMELSDAS